MASFVKGDVVVVPFPFSESDGSKRRPALVLASWVRGGKTDYLVCIITSQFSADPFLIELDADDIIGGALAQKSYLRPTYLYATGEARILRRIGTLQAEKTRAAAQALVNALTL